jgi:hypothetical protein
VGAIEAFIILRGQSFSRRELGERKRWLRSGDNDDLQNCNEGQRLDLPPIAREHSRLD